ncbi:MAG TPA: MBL fold metallo-hydrolase [Xanthomonadales bacterium]|nr:MBL fold metallo-hydrolase [Xanthomonadales bacterium]
MTLAVAEQWYGVTTCADGISLLFEQHVDPGLRCNIWHIRGRNRDLLVDSGLGVMPLRDEVARLSDRPVLAVASHTHFDHIGNHHEFGQRCCHPAEAGILSQPDEANTVWQQYRDMMGEQPLLTALPYAGFDFADYRVQPAPPTQLIHEADELDLGDRVFRVFHMPGHSPGSVCLYEGKTRTLFAGDVLYDGELLDALYHSNREQYRETLARLREIPAEVFHCGHYASFGRHRAQQLIDAYLVRRA